jgi:hypothetical protein
MPIYEYHCNNCGTISEFLVGESPKDESIEAGYPRILNQDCPLNVIRFRVSSLEILNQE